jgi:hypothetical protein
MENLRTSIKRILVARNICICQKLCGRLLRRDRGRGNTVIMWSRVCVGTGVVFDFVNLCNTAPFVMGLRVFSNYFGSSLETSFVLFL